MARVGAIARVVQPAVARASKLPWPTGGVLSRKSRTAGGGARSAGTGLWLVSRGVRHGRSQSRQGVARRTRLNTVTPPKFRREWQLRRQLKRPLQSRAHDHGTRSRGSGKGKPCRCAAAASKSEGSERMRWGVEKRLEFIEFRLLWEGGINRVDIME